MTSPTFDSDVGAHPATAEIMLMQSIDELLTDARRFVVAGEYGMLQDTLEQALKTLAGGVDSLPKYDVLAVWQTRAGRATQRLQVSAPTRNVALLEARAQIIDKFHLPADTHVRTLLDVEPVTW